MRDEGRRRSEMLAPFAAGALPGAWMDGIVDAMQEDYCTRPVASVMP